MMTLGEAFKQIRLNKNNSLTGVSQGIISVAQLSRFENNLQDIGANKLLELLAQLNSSFSELRAIQLAGEPDSEFLRLSNETSRLYQSGQKEKMMSLLQSVYQKVKNNDDPKRFLIYFIAPEFLTHDHLTNADVIDHVHLYLQQIKNWGPTELTLYNMYSTSFTLETLHAMQKTALKQADHYQDISGAAYLPIYILNTNFSIYISHERLDWAAEILDISQEFLHHSYATDAVLMHLLFNRGLLAFKHQQPEEATRKCQQAIELCHLFDSELQARFFQMRLAKWQTNYQDPDFRDYVI